MPQKRNPVALERARAISSKGLEQAGAILLTVHNTPFGDIVDTEDDLQPLVLSMFRDAIRAVRLVAAAMKDAQFDRAKLAGSAERGWITATELADTLTRNHGLAFKTSHATAARFVAARSSRPGSSGPASCARCRRRCWMRRSHSPKRSSPEFSARGISWRYARRTEGRRHR
jgi:argininosuccinate lyase